MKDKDIAKISISENNPYQAEEDWVTITAEDGFMCDNIGKDAKIYLLKQKLNEVIELLNKIKNEQRNTKTKS